MEFYKSKVYTSVNADELKIGSMCIFANTIADLRNIVQDEDARYYMSELTQVFPDSVVERFEQDDTEVYALAYLIEPPAEPKYKPFSSVENLKKAVEKHDRLIAIKQSIKKATIIGISFDEKIIISTPSWGISYLTFEQFFESYIFADGFPCGELAE